MQSNMSKSVAPPKLLAPLATWNACRLRLAWLSPRMIVQRLPTLMTASAILCLLNGLQADG